MLSMNEFKAMVSTRREPDVYRQLMYSVFRNMASLRWCRGLVDYCPVRALGP